MKSIIMLAYDKVNNEFHKVDEFELNVRTSISYYSSRNNSKSSLRSIRRNELKRIITKTGRLNTFLSKLPNRNLVFFRDFGNTLLHIRWRWILLTICLVNFACFYLFGGIWMLVAFISGDFEKNATSLCVVNVNSFTGYVLLSIETIMTIGYGYRYPTEQCQQGWLLQISQVLISIAIQGVLISVVYVKTAKPFTRNTKSIFSKNAVICLRDGELCLIIRLFDLAGKILIGTKISMFFVDKDDDTFIIKEIKLQPYGFLIFPLEIVHIIDDKSPLWQLTPQHILNKRFEIIIVAEGTSIITSQFSQNRTSYTNSDILWGYRFTSYLEFDQQKPKYYFEYKKFNKVLPYNTPLCSAEELTKIKKHLHTTSTLDIKQN